MSFNGTVAFADTGTEGGNGVWLGKGTLFLSECGMDGSTI